jgi:endonuclease/exonuclease/phosphatase family metal-dependent hydrolase
MRGALATLLAALALPCAVAPTLMSFNLLQYNIFGRPYVVSHDGQQERLERIASAVEAADLDVDVVTFAESDDSSERASMFAAFSRVGYKYHTTVVTDYDSKSILNGGVVIGSRWPIIKHDQIVYRSACSGADCLAAKGVNYARVVKTVGNESKVFNVFATHMQAWSAAVDKADRVKQAQQFKSFVTSQAIPANEPVIMSGDFNCDLVRYPGEVSGLIKNLDASMPEMVGDIKFTSDPATNLLVGRDGGAGNCTAGYEKSWGALDGTKTYSPSEATRVPTTMAFPPTTDTGAAVLPFFKRETNHSFCPCCPNEWLDYVLWSNAHQQPEPSAPAPTLAAVNLKLNASNATRVAWDGTMQPVPHPAYASAYMDLVDLSDHYPVIGRFVFAVDGPVVDNIYGCRNNDDCSFHASFLASCYCDGAGCTWDGKHVDGWEEGASNPVNDNCHYHLTSLTCACHKEIKGSIARSVTIN